MPEQHRLDTLLSLAQDQLRYLTDNTRFFDHPTYRRRVTDGIDSLDDLGAVPIQHGNAVRRTQAHDLLPVDPKQVYRSHGTGGTTGDSMDVLDTRSSWYTSVDRMVAVAQESPHIAFNTYNRNHITHEILNEVLIRNGGSPRSRSLTDSARTMLERMERNDCTMLIAPGSTPETAKGHSVADLWDADENGYIADNIERVWYSSTPLPAEYRERLEDAGITIEGFFGNTEVRAFGYAPPQHPDIYHLIEGQYFVVGMDDEGSLHRHGEDLRVLVSAVAGSHDGDDVGQHTGSGFFLYETGDLVNISPPGTCPHHEDCPLETATISDIRRVERIEEKQVSGCQVG